MEERAVVMDWAEYELEVHRDHTRRLLGLLADAEKSGSATVKISDVRACAIIMV